LRGNPVKSEIIKVTKVFKGNLSPGTVEIIHYIQSVVYETPEEEKNARTTMDSTGFRKYHKRTDGIFFCRLAKEFPRDPRYNIDPTDNKIILTYYHNGKYNLGLYGDRIVSSSHGYTGEPTLKTGKIITKAEIYRILRRYPNLNIPATAEQEPGDEADNNSRFGPHSDFKSKAQLQAYIDSVNRARGFTKPEQRVQKKDSLKNGTRP